MTWLNSIRSWWKNFIEKRVTPQNPTWWLLQAFGAQQSLAGVDVNDRTAMQWTSNYAAIGFMADLMAMIPIHVIEKNPTSKAKRRVDDHDLEFLLNTKPNPDMSAFTFRETTQLHLGLKHRAFTHIVRNGMGKVLELWPLDPNMVVPEYERSGGIPRLTYRYTPQDGNAVRLDAPSVAHFRVLSWNGIDTQDKVQLFREAIGLSLAMEHYSSAYYGNGARPDGVIEVEEEVGPEWRAQMREEWNKNYQGPKRAGKTAVLDDGAKYRPIQAHPEEAQASEARKLQIDEASRMHRIPPHFLGNLERATFSNIEEQGINLVRYTLLPNARRMTSEMNVKLLSPRELRAGLRLEYNLEALEMGELLKRYQAYWLGIQGGFLSPNEIRRKEDMNDREGGDIFLRPANMEPAILTQGVMDGTFNPSEDDQEEEEDRASREPLPRLHRVA